MANVGNGVITTWSMTDLSITVTATAVPVDGAVLESYSNSINQVYATAITTPAPGTRVNVLNPESTNKFKSR